MYGKDALKEKLNLKCRQKRIALQKIRRQNEKNLLSKDIITEMKNGNLISNIIFRIIMVGGGNMLECNFL
jgi:hypothetical protein